MPVYQQASFDDSPHGGALARRQTTTNTIPEEIRLSEVVEKREFVRCIDQRVDLCKLEPPPSPLGRVAGAAQSALVEAQLAVSFEILNTRTRRISTLYRLIMRVLRGRRGAEVAVAAARRPSSGAADGECTSLVAVDIVASPNDNVSSRTTLAELPCENPVS